MSFFFNAPNVTVTPDSMAGGQATLGDIWEAGRDQMIHVDNSFARRAAREEAYDRRIAAIEEATGVTLENPLRQTYSRGERKRGAPSPAERWQARVSELAEQYPDAGEAIGFGVPIEEDAKAIARAAEERLALVLGSRPGPMKWAAMLGGGVAGSLRDPVQVAALVAGAGPGAARTVAGRILSAAGREAMVNAGIEAAMQPAVQAWRKEAGLDAGFDEAMRNIVFAAGLGGALGGAGQGAGEAARLLARGRSADAAVDVAGPALTDTGRAAIAVDPDLSVPALRPIREALPAEARGALDQMEIESALDQVRRAPDAPPADAAAERAALRLAQDREPPPAARGGLETGNPVSAVEGRPGAQTPDERVAAAGFDIKRLPQDEGAALVMASSRETEAMVVSQQRLRALRQERDDLAAVEPSGRIAPDGTPELETRPPEGGFVGRSPAEAERAGLPMAFSEGERPQRLADLDRRIADLEVELVSGPLAEDLAVVDAARATRGSSPPDATGGVDDPAAPREDLLIAPEDFEAAGEAVPLGDGIATPDELRDALDRMEGLERVVEACRA